MSKLVKKRSLAFLCALSLLLGLQITAFARVMDACENGGWIHTVCDGDALCEHRKCDALYPPLPPVYPGLPPLPNTQAWTCISCAEIVDWEIPILG